MEGSGEEIRPRGEIYCQVIIGTQRRSRNIFIEYTNNYMVKGEGITVGENVLQQTLRMGEKFKAVGDRAKFGIDMVVDRIKKPEWVREEQENKARRGLMTNLILDRENPPLSAREIHIHTQEAVSKLDLTLHGRESVMIGDKEGDALVFQRDQERRYVAAHFTNGALRTMAVVDAYQGTDQPTRVLMNDTHEGRIESSDQEEHSFTRTAVHTFNFLVKRGTRKFLPQRSLIISAGSIPPFEFTEQIMSEIEPPNKLKLGEELFNEINESEGKPLANGGVLIITDTAIGNPLAATLDRWRLGEGVMLPRYSEIDDFMNILACRGDQLLSEKVKAFGHTSRGTSFTAATQLAATIGATRSKPVFPGYNPYLQHNETPDPIRPSPTVFAVLELGKAKMAGREVVLVDEAPTTDRVYETVDRLAKERGIDLSKIPTIFMVGVNINEQTNQAELISNALNFNITMGTDKDQPRRGIYNSDTRRGFEKALEMFNDMTLFTPQAGVTGIPLSDFEDFYKFMSKSGNAEYQRIANIFQIRAKEFSNGRRSLEETGRKILGKPLNIEPNSFPAQDTLIGAYLIHPEWFIVQQLPLNYTTLSGEARVKDRVRVVTGLTEEGRGNFRKWLWDSIEENFKEEAEREAGIQFNVENGYASHFDGPYTRALVREQPGLKEHPDVLPTFDVINPGQKTAIIYFRGLSRRPVNERKGTAEFVRWHDQYFEPVIRDSITYVQVRYSKHTHHRELLNAQCLDYLVGQRVQKVHIVGLSYGGGPAFDLAHNIAEKGPDINVETVSLLSGLTNKQELRSGLGVAWSATSKLLQGPRIAGIGIPSGWYAHTRGVAVRYEGIPDQPFAKNDMPKEAKVLLVGSETDGVVDHIKLVRDVKSIYPDARVIRLDGWHDLSETELWKGYKTIADFISENN